MKILMDNWKTKVKLFYNDGCMTTDQIRSRTKKDLSGRFILTSTILSRHRRRCHRLKGIHSRSDTSRTGAEGLSFYYPRLPQTCLALVPLTSELATSGYGYKILNTSGQISNLFYMDDLKLCSRNE